MGRVGLPGAPCSLLRAVRESRDSSGSAPTDKNGHTNTIHTNKKASELTVAKQDSVH